VIDRDFGVEGNQLAVGGRVVDLRTSRAHYSDVFIGLHGRYQATNAAIAVAAAEEFFEAPLDDAVVREAFENIRIPGRVEVVHRQPLAVLDGAHNVAGATALASTLDEEFGESTGRVLVVGMLQGHDPAEMLPALQAQRSRLVIACTAPSPRAVPAAQIASAAKDLGLPCVTVEDVGEAVKEGLSAAEEDEMVLVTGSLYVVGAARSALVGIS
jgi:dihydrofolate synthase/folylpolyglutamate synthase